MAVDLALPYAFVAERALIDWRDLQYALDRGWVRPEVAVDKAVDVLCHDAAETAPDDVIRMAGLSDQNEIAEVLAHLAAGSAVRDDELQPKWAFLLLAWVFEHREEVPDPLGMVEKIYADFGYPSDLAPFVRYMPMVGPDLGTRDRNEARMYRYWEDYLIEARRRFGNDRASP